MKDMIAVQPLDKSWKIRLLDSAQLRQGKIIGERRRCNFLVG
jgi:hypothetical protein